MQYTSDASTSNANMSNVTYKTTQYNCCKVYSQVLPSNVSISADKTLNDTSYKYCNIRAMCI